MQTGLCWLAWQVFQEMVWKGCERSVITYSSLISACEKAGHWELAMELFNEMHQEGCTPNTVTYNSLITACAQGTPTPTSPFNMLNCIQRVNMQQEQYLLTGSSQHTTGFQSHILFVDHQSQDQSCMKDP